MRPRRGAAGVMLTHCGRVVEMHRTQGTFRMYWVHIRGMIPVHELRQLKVLADATLSDASDKFGETDDKNKDSPSRSFHDLPDDKMQVLIRRHDLVGLIYKLFGDDQHGEFAVIRAGLFVDPPGSSPQLMHRDIPHLNHADDDKLACQWYSLINILILLEGDSHLMTHFQDKPMQGPVLPGDVIIFDGMQWHCGMGNKSGRVRRAVHITMLPKTLLKHRAMIDGVREYFNSKVRMDQGPCARWIQRAWAPDKLPEGWAVVTMDEEIEARKGRQGLEEDKEEGAGAAQEEGRTHLHTYPDTQGKGHREKEGKDVLSDKGLQDGTSKRRTGKRKRVGGK